VLADDPGNGLLLILVVALGVLRIRIPRRAERHADRHPHPPLLRTMGLVDQKGHPQTLEVRIILDLLQHPDELLLSGHDDRLTLLQQARQMVSLACQTHHVLEVREVLEIVPDVGIERFAVRQDEDDVHQLLAGARLEEAVKPVRKPADGECLAAPGRMADQIFPTDVPRRREMRRGIVRDLPHHATLVITRQNGDGRAFRLIVLGLAVRHPNQEERQHFEQLVLREHLAVQKLDRVLAVGLRQRIEKCLAKEARFHLCPSFLFAFPSSRRSY
jgi:hypothetical protein